MMPRDSAAAPASAASGRGIVLEGVSKSFPAGTQALAPVDLQVASGEFVSIVGPSGCGKSTLLRILAGLIPPTTGQAWRPDDMTAAFVFQEAALLPWLNVEANAELVMQLEGRRHGPRKAAAAEALRLVGLSGFEKAYPHELSGGMRMRLSLARAIALKPGLLLLDEPLGAIDELTREGLQEQIAELWAVVGFAAVLVTHSVSEAVFLSNRVVVMSDRPGRIKRVVEVSFDFPRSPDLRATPAFAEFAGDISRTLREREQEPLP